MPWKKKLKNPVEKVPGHSPQRPSGQVTTSVAGKPAVQPTAVHSSQVELSDLINAESALGRTLFGEIPVGHRREFFAARKNVWIWYESWADQLGQEQQMTIRYEVHPNGVFKRLNQGQYERIEGEELDNFRLAAKSYLKLIKQHLYY